MSVIKGFNLFTRDVLQANLLVNPGYVLVIDNLNGIIAVDTSNSGTFGDYYLPSGAQGLSKLSATFNYRILIRSLISPIKYLSLMHVYKTPGSYQITAQLSHRHLNFPSLQFSKTVQIQQGIDNLTVITPKYRLACPTQVACQFAASVSAGDSITYSWYFGNNNYSGSTDSVVYNNYSTAGIYLLFLIAKNSVSRRVFQANITVLNELDGLNFFSGVSKQSASAVAENASFLFYLKSGNQYTCIVDFGDSTSFLISDSVENLNNTIINKLYTAEQMHIIKINCGNLVSSINLVFSHYVQYRIAGASLVSSGVLINSPYSVDFKITSGTNPQIDFTFNNAKLIENVDYNYSNFLCKSIPRPGEPTTSIKKVYIIISNYISFQMINSTFEISSPIINPNLRINTPYTFGTVFAYPDTTLISFQFDMSSGTNVKIQIFYGDEADSSVPSESWICPGDWIGPILRSHNYSDPADYKLTIILTNVVNTSLLINTIPIVSKLDGIQAGLFSSPVVWTPSGGIANYKFWCVGIPKGCSHATVVFSPGDAKNPTYGPFSVGMDVINNYNKVSLSYTYMDAGLFTANFSFVNPLGFKTITASILVAKAIYGFYIYVQPSSIAPGKKVTVSAFMLQGTGVNLTWYLDGTMISNRQRSCK